MLVFPYGYDCEPIIRHANLLKSGYEIVALVSPGGWGLAGKDIVLGSNGKALYIYETIHEVREEFDSLFIPAFEVIEEEVENRLVDEMVKLLPSISYVICTAHLTDENQKKLEEACRQIALSCCFFDFYEYEAIKKNDWSMTVEKYTSLQQLDVPIVIVAGVWEKNDKFEISLALRERFIQNDYRISQIGSRDGCEMMGFHSFPKFMFQKDFDAADRIILFNRFVFQMINEEQPDLVLITVPGAIQDFSEKFIRGFGLLHHQVCQAVLPDILVMCSCYMPDHPELLEEISMSCRYRFGAVVDVFHMSNLLIDVHDSEERNSIVTNSIYRKTVSETVARKFANSSIPIFNGLEPEDCDKMFNIIIDKLMPKDVRFVV